MSQAESAQLIVSEPGMDLRASIVPWDTRALGFPVAQIDEIDLVAGGDHAATIDRLVSWLDKERVRFVSCRLDSLKLQESMLLEEVGFRFVEMVYSPVLEGLDGGSPDEEIVIAPAAEDDRSALQSIASSAFSVGRHVLDWRLDEHVGHNRYRGWLDGAMADDDQEVLKASINGLTIGFFVVEQAPGGTVYWHLMAIARDARGYGIGKRFWRSMVARHQAEGASRIETTVSAHNTPVINICAGLGFRFTAPRSTFHWLR